MCYGYTPEEAQSIANDVAKYLRQRKYKVAIESACDPEAPYRTTLLAKREHLSILIECQNNPFFEQSLNELALWQYKQASCAELYVASHRSKTFSGDFLKKIGRAGIGLMIIEDGNVVIEKEPINPALTVKPDPSLKYGKFKKEVDSCVSKFNQPNSILLESNPRKDALRDLCEVVEGLTEEVAITAIQKKHIKYNEKDITNMKWANQIDTLATKKAYLTGKSPVVSSDLKNDLHSFRGARNLFSHKVSKREEIKRQVQAAERMMMGARLVNDLVGIKTSLSRVK